MTWWIHLVNCLSHLMYLIDTPYVLTHWTHVYWLSHLMSQTHLMCWLTHDMKKLTNTPLVLIETSFTDLYTYILMHWLTQHNLLTCLMYWRTHTSCTDWHTSCNDRHTSCNDWYVSCLSWHITLSTPHVLTDATHILTDTPLVWFDILYVLTDTPHVHAMTKKVKKKFRNTDMDSQFHCNLILKILCWMNVRFLEDLQCYFNDRFIILI